jgi:uncharacterized membrane protein
MSPGSHVTLATSTGLVWLMLAIHVLGGIIALSAGFVAVVAPKGGRRHRTFGLVFVVSMFVMAAFATAIGAYEMKMTGVGGVLTAYLVFTGLTTVRPVANLGRPHQIALMVLACLIALFELSVGAIAIGRPRGMINGVPAGMILFIGTIALLAAIGDWRMLRAGGIKGARRLARHLWRMCFALFIASGSFFLGQMKFVPEPVRALPLMMALGVAPLVVLLYWMWRIRLRQSLRGLIVNSTRDVAAAPGAS